MNAAAPPGHHPGRDRGGRALAALDSSRVLRTVRNLLLPVVGRIPAFHTRLTRELAELDYR
ncbi:hypothetical protein [Streptomyces sp. SPB162]|uniref:hypothetical protein n=1 Tax=Streptomyces sp. SPB162 TaxID=2940560 RepID=UPI0024062175|nr:hypothetical protein [Streptomyces sp. SPB162]MDF9816345.1 hypothetical protein [Streptomyces sp. SPB162]